MSRKQAKPWFEVRQSPIHGSGAFALRRIPEGTWVAQYTGEVITNEEADRRYDDASMAQHHTFLFVLDEGWCIDAAVGGGDARFINHSCAPNCDAVYAEGDREIWIVAKRTIQPGEELTYDYAYQVDGEDLESARRDYPCRCGAPACRGTILQAPA